jgi:hypothetical protein
VWSFTGALRGCKAFWEASKDCPQTGRDLAFLLPANRSSLRNKVYPMSFQKHFPCNIRLQYFSSSCNMAAFSRGIRSFVSRLPQEELICSRCLFSTTSTLQSGHSRWSKIKHDKGKADANKGSQRTSLSREIALASKSMFRSLQALRPGC